VDILYPVSMGKKKGCRPGFKRVKSACMYNGWLDKGKMVFKKGAKLLKIQKVPGTKKDFKLLLGNKQLAKKKNLGGATGAAYKYMKAN